MDGTRFDTIARTLATPQTRRGLIVGLTALVVGPRVGSAQDGCPPGQARNRKGECRCPPGTEACPDGCFDRRDDPNNCGACGTVCPAGAECRKGECRCPVGGCAPVAPPAFPPAACTTGNDPLSGAPWVVCRADAESAWISHNIFDGGVYHPTTICQGLGYADYDLVGGTGGAVCGFNDDAESCLAPGNEIYDAGGLCGNPLGSDEICFVVHWRCVAAL